jgi:hypothetical protein
MEFQSTTVGFLLLFVLQDDLVTVKLDTLGSRSKMPDINFNVNRKFQNLYYMLDSS